MIQLIIILFGSLRILSAFQKEHFKDKNTFYFLNSKLILLVFYN